MGELFRRLATLGLGTLLLAALIFFIVPRPGRAAWRGAMLFPKSLVGFSDKITLGQLGEILESHEEVMRVQLTDPQDGRPYPPQSLLYLRGTVLTHYAADSGPNLNRTRPRRNALIPFGGRSVQQYLETIGALPQWLSALEVAWRARHSGNRRQTPFAAVVSQRIHIEPLDRDEVFSVWPPVLTGRNIHEAIVFDREPGRLRRRGDLHGLPLEYQLDTTGFDAGHAAPVVPCNDPGAGAAADDLPTDMDLWLPPPEESFPKLTALARQWLDERGPRRPLQPRPRARNAIESNPDQFQYSLQGQPAHVNLDPIEDFVVKQSPRALRILRHGAGA